MIKNIVIAVLTMIIIGSSSVKASTNEIGIFDSKRVVFTFEEEFRMKNQSTPLFYEHSDFQMKYLINTYVDVFTDYRFILQNKGKGFKDQSMFLEGFNLKYPENTNWGKINLRSRVEIGLNESPTPTTYQLNEFLKYNTPWKFTKFKINPFVADESFYDVQHNFDFVKNRVYVGVDWEISKKAKCSTYYYKEDAKANPWTHADVAVTQIKFEF